MKRRGFVASIAASVALGSRIPFALASTQQYINIPSLFPSSDEIGAGWSLVDSTIILLDSNEAGYTSAYRAFYGGRSGRRVRMSINSFPDTEQAQAQAWGFVQQNIPYELTEVLYKEDRRAELASLPAPGGMIAATRIESTWNRYDYPITLGYYLYDVPLIVTMRLEGDIDEVSDYTAIDRIASLIRSRVSEN